MSLRDTTVVKFVEATRTPNAPFVRIASKAKQFATLELAQKELRNVGVQATFTSSDSFSSLQIEVDLDVDVDDLLPENDLNYYHHFLKLHFVDNILQLRCGYGDIWRSINDVPHIVRIVEPIKVRLREQWKQKQKRIKIHDLHVRAIELQIMALAKRLDLGCRFERLHTQLWICLFDSPIESGVQAYIPLDDAPHEHIAKFEKAVAEFHQRVQKRARRRSAREMQK
jgi:hypothetical protein